MSSVQIGGRVRVEARLDNATLVAPATAVCLSPEDGFVTSLDVIVQDTIATGGTVIAQVGGTNVPGLSITIPNGTAKGTVFSAKTTKGAVERVVSKNGVMQVYGTGFSGAGSLKNYLTVSANDNPQMPY